jgi:glycine/D-amino acid oxidase-like deaminating enzyme
MEWLDSPDDAAPQATAALFEAQVLRAARRFPDLEIPLRPSGIVGVYDVSDDWIPVYDRTALPGFYVAVGTSGNQFKNAPVVGELMAALIGACEAGHDHDADPVRYPCRATGLELDLATFSRKRERHPGSSGTVMG